jgi:hydrogenase maturation protease
MSRPRLLVAGIGNIFLGDDAFGVEVARRLALQGLPDEARIIDFGIRGLDLTYALLDGYETVVLVDAIARGEPPGTLSVLELPTSGTEEAPAGMLVEAHNLDPARVLQLASSLGAKVGRLILVGCEPTPSNDPDDFGSDLSAAALAAVDEAVPLITTLVASLLRGEPIEAWSDNGTESRTEVET